MTLLVIIVKQGDSSMCDDKSWNTQAASLPSSEVSSLFLATSGGFPAQSTATRRYADAWERDCKTDGLPWTESSSHNTPSPYFRKFGNKQTTYSTSVTQEGANSSCDQRFKEKSELKLLLGAMAVERGDPTQPGAGVTARCPCAPRQPSELQLQPSHGWTHRYSCECSKASASAQPYSLSPTNSKAPKQQTCADSCCPRQKHSLSLQGKPPKEGRHSPAMLKPLVPLKYKRCFY